MKKIITTCLMFVTVSCAFGQYELNWNSKIGSLAHDDCRGITLSDNFIYSTGRIEGDCIFDDGTSFSTEVSSGADDIFVAKSDLDGNYIWVKSMGGTLGEQAVDIATGPNGDVYITGFFESTFDFDPGAGVSTLTPVGEKDVFIARFSTNGDLVWVKQISGTLTEQSEGITILSDGVVVSGRFKGTVDFDPSAATVNLTSTGQHDIFVVKLDLDGNYAWANNYGTTANDISWGVEKDEFDAVFLTGQFRNTIQFEAGNSASSHTSQGGNDIFVLKLNSAGVYQWSKSIGGTGFDAGSKIDLDSDNNVFISGFYEGTTDFDPDMIAVSNMTSTGGRDAFLLKLDAAGEFVWSNSIGSVTGNDKGKGVKFDLAGNIYHVGLFTGTVTVAGTDLISNGLTDCFIQKFDQSGTELWGASYGGMTDDFLNGIVIDADTSIYFNGKFSSTTDIDPTAGDSLVSPFGGIDGYMFKWKLEDILVSSITVQGVNGIDIITIADGTLQIEAEILPVNATNDTYTWTVTNGTGSATIDVNGLLTAVADGIVTVVATANDASGLIGSTDITITNQSLGINIFDSLNLSIYPNPSNGKLFVKNLKENTTIQLFSVRGVLISEYYTNDNEVFEINTENLSTGIYFLKIENQVYKFSKN